MVYFLVVKKYLYILIVIFAISIFIFLTAKDKPQNSNLNSETPTSTQNSQVSDSTVETELKGKYQTFESETLNTNLNKRRVLFFYANWCPTCRPVNEELNRSEDLIPDDLVIIRVNYNDSDTDKAEQELARKYGVTYQHTFVQIDESGMELKKWNGGGLREILNNLNQ